MTNQEQYELICEKAKKYDRLVRVLDKIRAEIEHMIPCSKEALSMKLGVLDIIDMYRKEQEE